MGVGWRQTTSRFKPLSDEHRRIGFRLIYIRKCKGLSQGHLAADVGLTLSQLANVEAGRVPLKAEAAWKLCQRLDMHPRWLHSGHTECVFPSLSETQTKWFYALTAEHRAETFWDFWGRFGFLFLEDQADYFQQIALRGHVPSCDAGMGNEYLTFVPPKSKTKGVKSEIQKLIEQVKHKASRPGAKAELARALGVAPARITEWLSGEKEPGGEYTLRLQRWVKGPER